MTDEVIITDKRIAHIVKRRGQNLIAVSTGNPAYKSSIITAIGENLKRFESKDSE